MSNESPMVGFLQLTQTYSTLFQSDVWPMKDDAEPLHGWSLREVLEQRAGPASNDLYGKMYRHLHDLLSSFRRRLRTSHSCNFKLFHVDAKVLAGQLGDAVTFDRIEVQYTRMAWSGR